MDNLIVQMEVMRAMMYVVSDVNFTLIQIILRYYTGYYVSYRTQEIALRRDVYWVLCTVIVHCFKVLREGHFNPIQNGVRPSLTCLGGGEWG